MGSKEDVEWEGGHRRERVVEDEYSPGGRLQVNWRKLLRSRRGFIRMSFPLCVAVSLSHNGTSAHESALCSRLRNGWHIGMKGRWLVFYTKFKCNLALDPPGFLCLLCPLFFLRSVITGQSDPSSMLVWLPRAIDRTQLRANGCQASACSGTLTRYSVSTCLICHSAVEIPT